MSQGRQPGHESDVVRRNGSAVVSAHYNRAMPKFWCLALLVASVALACGEAERHPAPDSSGGRGSTGGATTLGGASALGGAASRGGNSSSGGVTAVGGEATAGDAGAASLGGTASGGSSTAGAPGDEAGAGGAEAGAPGAAGAPAQHQPNRVFITRASYAPSAIGGALGADSLCAQAATAAALPGTFVAWLSEPGDLAPAGLGAARGFVRPDQRPFADEVSDLVERGQVFFPLRYDQFGNPVSGRVATGTLQDGSLGDTCQNWTSDDPNDTLTAGEPTAGTGFWTEDAAEAHCDALYHLICFQTDHRAPLYPTPTQARNVFVSSQDFVLGPRGRDAADALCAADAAAVGYRATYVALLGNATQSPLARLIEPSRAWVRPDGMPIASATSEILLTGPSIPITMLATGDYIAGPAVFGAADLNAPVTLDCDDWTDPQAATPAVVRGIVGYTDERWFAAETGACSEPARVICAER